MYARALFFTYNSICALVRLQLWVHLPSRSYPRSLLTWRVHDNHSPDVCFRDISDRDQACGSPNLQDECEEESPPIRTPRRLGALFYLM